MNNFTPNGERAHPMAVAAPALVYRLGRRTDVGMVRTVNQDSLLTIEINYINQNLTHPLGIYVAADGMGGHAAGEVASGVIIHAIAQKSLLDFNPLNLSSPGSIRWEAWLDKVVVAANKAVYESRILSGSNMGSTLVMAVMHGDQVSIANVGDSRAYLINVQGIHQLTTDHSLVERLVAASQITRQEARVHPQRNVIYRTIGQTPEVDVDIVSCQLEANDYLLLCSDGLSGKLEDEQIWNTTLAACSPQEACDRLVDAANAAGGEDNITAIVVQVVQS